MDFDDLAERISHCLSAHAYYRCALLVHPQLERLEAAARHLAERTGWPQLEVGRRLVDLLLAQPPARRGMAASTALDPLLVELRPGPVILVDLPLLFEPALALDPPALLRGWSRRLPLVACWPGSLAAEGLAYAAPEHAHYRLWRNPGLDAACLMALEEF